MDGLPGFHHFNLGMSHVSPLPSVAHQPAHPVMHDAAPDGATAEVIPAK